jgi:hypothetical protein
MMNPFSKMLAELEEAIAHLEPHCPDRDEDADRDADDELNSAIGKFIGTAE